MSGVVEVSHVEDAPYTGWPKTSQTIIDLILKLSHKILQLGVSYMLRLLLQYLLQYLPFVQERSRECFAKMSIFLINKR